MSNRLARMYGELVDPSGQPAAGVGMVITRQTDGACLANTVSDSNGAFVLVFHIPEAASTEDGEYQLQLSVNKSPIMLPDLHDFSEGLKGPYKFVTERRPSKEIEGVAPRLNLIGTEEEILTAFKNAPHLFGRPAAARPPDPCSPYTPAEVPARVFYLNQLAMFPGPASAEEEDSSRLSHSSRSVSRHVTSQGSLFEGTLRYGALLEFKQEWWDRFYALGDLLYSVPLAPCEETKIATVDWRRRDYVKRQTVLDETHYQDTTIHRDEIINECVTFILPEKKITGTTEGGGGAISLGPLSGGYAKNIETVTEAANTASTTASRNINDNIHQISNTLRNTRSFAIAEVNQEEESVVRTRVLRNHNYCHTVTFQYFQVLRHYLIRTRLNNVRPAVFVPFNLIEFTPALVSRYGYLLRRALLDPTLEPAFDKVLGITRPQLPTTTGPTLTTTLPEPKSSEPNGEQEITEFKVSALGGIHNGKLSDFSLYINDFIFTSGHTGSEGSSGQRSFEEGTLSSRTGATASIKSREIETVSMQSNGTQFTIAGLVVSAKVDGQWHMIFDKSSLELKKDAWFFEKIERSVLPTAPTVATAPANTDTDASRLIEHLNANPVYYTAAIISGGDAGLRYMALTKLKDWRNQVLADVVDNTIVGFVGNYAAFPLKGQQLPPGMIEGGAVGEEVWPDLSKIVSEPAERIITLPTPGVFAESQLGGCSACEEIDNTRFWDWQKSPCPEEAPDITSEMLASRYQDLQALVDVVKSDLVPKDVQIPEQPEPMIKIGDATMAELVKGLNLKDAGDVLDFVKGLVDTSAEGFKEMVSAIKGSQPATGGTPGGTTTGSPGGTGATGAAAGSGLPASEAAAPML